MNTLKDQLERIIQLKEIIAAAECELKPLRIHVEGALEHQLKERGSMNVEGITVTRKIQRDMAEVTDKQAALEWALALLESSPEDGAELDTLSDGFISWGKIKKLGGTLSDGTLRLYGESIPGVAIKPVFATTYTRG